MPMTDEELRREAGALNAILANASTDLRGASEAAQIRAREQAARRLQRDKDAAARDRATIMASAYDPYGHLTAPEQRKAREQEQTHAGAGDAITAIESLPEGSTSTGITNWATSVLRDLNLPNVAKAVNSIVYDSDEQLARAMTDASVESFKRALAGANLTAAEVGLSANWDPSQALTDEERVMRLRQMQTAIERNREVLELPPLTDRGTGFRGVPPSNDAPVGTGNKRIKFGDLPGAS